MLSPPPPPGLPHFPPPAGVGFSKQSPSSPGKVRSEEGVQLQAGAGQQGQSGGRSQRPGNCWWGPVSQEASRHPHPAGAPTLAAAEGTIFWASCLPEHLLPAPGDCSGGNTMASSLRCHLVASACQFPELGLSFLILRMGVGWEYALLDQLPQSASG